MGETLPDKDVPGWTFSYEEVSNGVYRIAGLHRDGRSVSHMGIGLDAPLKECKEDARNLPERRHA